MSLFVIWAVLPVGILVSSSVYLGDIGLRVAGGMSLVSIILNVGGFVSAGLGCLVVLVRPVRVLFGMLFMICGARRFAERDMIAILDIEQKEGIYFRFRYSLSPSVVCDVFESCF